MKTKLFLSLLLSFSFYLLSSQIPQGFTYQAIARDATGNPLLNQALPVRITIQSDSIGGTTFWIEEHPSVTTNGFGLFTLVLGKGVRQTGSSVPSFNDIDWRGTPKFIKTEINYGGWKNMGSSRLWSVPYSMVAGDLSGAVKKLAVAGETSDMEEALFEVKNKSGQTVFAVYNEGVRIYVDDGNAKGATKGGFAIGGFSTFKSPGQEYLRVTRDSTRVYVNDGVAKGATKGGFAIGGFSPLKGAGQEYLRITPDSTRIYVNGDEGKGAKKGGFAIGGFDSYKGPGQEYLRVTPDSTRIYVNDDNTKSKTKGGFAIGGFSSVKGQEQEYLRVTRDSTRIYVNNNITKGAPKGGFAIGGFDQVKGEKDEYLRVTSDSVKVSKSLLIPRLTSYERDHLSFIPGEALIIFNTSEGCMQIFKNNVWSNIWCFNCAPDFLIQPVDNIICSGNNVNFFISATGTNLIYQWQNSTDDGNTWNNISNGGTSPAISGATSYSLKLSNVPVGYNNYKYRCFVSGPCPPNITSNAVSLNVGSAPPVITSQPVDQQLSNTCSAKFSLVSPGYGTSYQWQQSSDGGNTWNNVIDGGTSPLYSGSKESTLNLSNVPKTFINNKYRCVVSNLCGIPAISNIVNLSANSSPEIIVQPIDQWTLSGHNFTFYVSTSVSGLSFQWQESTNGGSNWDNINNGGSNPAYAGANDSVLLLSNIPGTMSGYKFRCVISHFCRPDEITNSGTLTVISSGSVTDIDENTYSSVTIGSQVWMAENLKTTKYNNGSPIPLISDNTTWSNLSTPAYCWYNNDEATYKNREGALYNWFAVNTGNLCPTGWHVPTDADWHQLVLTLDPAAQNDVVESSLAGGKLKEAGMEHWLNPNTDATNETGFTARPSGARDGGYFFNFNYAQGFWWCFSERDLINAISRAISYNCGYILIIDRDKKDGHPVRCLKDN